MRISECVKARALQWVLKGIGWQCRDGPDSVAGFGWDSPLPRGVIHSDPLVPKMSLLRETLCQALHSEIQQTSYFI